MKYHQTVHPACSCITSYSEGEDGGGYSCGGGGDCDDGRSLGDCENESDDSMVMMIVVMVAW